MDAQNAAETDHPRPSAASPQPRQDSQVESKNPSALGSELEISPTDNKSKPASADEHDSDAETIVLPGKDDHSPSKARKVRQEDNSETDDDASKSRSISKASKIDADGLPLPARSSDAPGKKRLSTSTGASRAEKERRRRSKDGASSGLSSAPNSPTQKHRQVQHRRQRSDVVAYASDSEESTVKSSKSLQREKHTSGDRLATQKQKAPKVESDDEADVRKARRQRTTSAGVEAGRNSRDTRISSRPQRDTRTQSRSPPPQHRRPSTSTHLPSSNGLGQKKKRPPPPLQSTEYHSDDSSASASTQLRTDKLRALATPSNSESHMSPAKIVPHKKHLDAHGQTLLARACARGDYDGVRQRLEERPEDLNVADYAGNTPLQIAAINGCGDIVKLLIQAGCNLDCVNYDKDTPLLDAVDNGHLQVVQLLLDAGVNPRKANVNGEEPIDRVTEDTDHADEIRALLIAARKKAGDKRRTSEDRHSHHDPGDSLAPDSPRRSPAAPLPSGRRSTTGRATKTRNDLLYMPLDDKTLRQAAGRGDKETVARILQVKEGFDDPESMVAAARGGHDLVIQLLLGLGGANADPGPVSSLQADFATPILAAIGQENIKVVELLLEQQGFDPTRRFKGETYYEIARRRQGPNWKDEEHILRNAYDEYKRSHKDVAPNKSPGRKDREREEKRTKREEGRSDSKRERKLPRSPSGDAESKRKTSSKVEGQTSKRRSESFSTHGEDDTPKRGPGRPRKEDKLSTVHGSDREASPNSSLKSSKMKRSETDATAASSDGESAKPRRKLVSKGELRGEREKQKRISSSGKEPTSPRASHGDEPSEKLKKSEKYHDRTKVLKRDPARENESTSKKHRKSPSPEQSADVEKNGLGIFAKRRRLDGDASEKKGKLAALEDKTRKSNLSKVAGDEDSINETTRESRRNADRIHSSERVKIKSEEFDVSMTDAPLNEPSAEKANEAEALKKKQEAEAAKREKKRLEEEEIRAREEEERKQCEVKAARQREEEIKRKEDERRKREEERKKEEEKKRREEERTKEEERRRREEERKKEEERRKREEERKKREEERRKEEERKKREEEEKRRREEERKKAEEERKRREEERKKAEEERKQREEQERQRREQLEREALEAKRKQEEEERKERERRHREEMERKRAAREAETRRIREEQERIKLDKLPPLLRWLQLCPNPKLPRVAEKFRFMSGVRYDTIRPQANGTAEGREQWVLNAHVALLLGEKDLELSRYTAWERAPVSELAKITLWRTEWESYTLTAEKYWEIGHQLPGYYEGEDPASLSFKTKVRLKQAAWERFSATDMFFVKLSELLYTVPNIPHLRDMTLGVEYRELLESKEQAVGWKTPLKWKQDPGVERFHGFAPRFKYYVNGKFVREDMPTTHRMSSTPFPENRVPRRGLVQVFADDPEYEKICLEQGLGHLIKGRRSPGVPNGVQTPTAEAKCVNGTNGDGDGDAERPASGAMNSDTH